MKCQEEIDLLRALPQWRLFSLVGASADTWLPLYKLLAGKGGETCQTVHAHVFAKSELCLKKLTKTERGCKFGKKGCR